ncbi:MAG: serine protease [Gammaproteobacteria bacterium]|nr:serine protease [Gammaproteobacteria bacterium]
MSQQCTLPGSETMTSIVRIATSNGGNASGVVIGKDRVLTVAHAVDEGAEMMIRYSGDTHQAEVLALNIKNDLALLAADTGSLEPIMLTDGKLKRLEQVWAVGFPLALEQKLTIGLFQTINNGRLYTTTHVNTGNSGGGLLRCKDGAFELAGIVHGYVAYLDGGSYINIGDSTSVPATQIESFLQGAEFRKAYISAVGRTE